MTKYYCGTKLVGANPMTRQEYTDYRGWKLPENEEGSEEGYLVEYIKGGGGPNHPDHEGYISWSPKDVFEESYYQCNSMSFDHAFAALNDGCSVTRGAWKEAGGYLKLVQPVSTEDGVQMSPFILLVIPTEDGSIQTPWVPTLAELFVEDWSLHAYGGVTYKGD